MHDRETYRTSEEFDDALGDGVIAIDAQFQIISFNRGAERITGYGADDACGHHCYDIFKSTLCEKNCPLRETLKTHQGLSNLRAEISTMGGEIIPIGLTAVPLKNPRGGIIGVILTFRNIVELYSLTSEIVKEKNRLQAIVESVADGVFTVDPQWRITSFNKAAEEITGFPRQDAIGKPCHKIFRSRVCQEACPLRRTFESGQSISNFEFEIKSKDEKPVQISVSTALLIDEEGEIIGGVETFRDLSTLKHLRDELKKRYSFANILGKNPKMLKLYDLLGAVAETSSTVLVQGETGTGKDLVARAIHYNSPRRERPFIKVSCVALPEALLESELFGHTKGAFTGADRDKPGRFELAHKGTIFLDEIGDISKPVQLKLLRVLEEGEFERLGGTKTIKVDVRVVAATNRDLQEAVKGGGFREDLFYRLNVVPIHLPPLRERNDDIPLLVEHFIEKFNKKTGKKITSVTPEVMDILVDYPWPGNIRQLENAIEHAFVHCREGVIRPAHLPEELKAQRRSLVEGVALSSSPLAKLEKQILLDVLTKNNWDRHNAAAELKISRTTLWRKTKKYGVVQKR